MLAATRKEVHDAIVAAIQGLSGVGKVYGRVRRPPEETAGQIVDLFTTLKVLNVIFVRYVGLTREVSQTFDTVAKNYIFEIEVRYAWNESDGDDTASETLFNALLDSLDDAFTDTRLGFDPGVNIAGLDILRAIERDPQPFYGALCHTAYSRLVINVSQC